MYLLDMYETPKSVHLGRCSQVSPRLAGTPWPQPNEPPMWCRIFVDNFDFSETIKGEKPHGRQRSFFFACSSVVLALGALFQIYNVP